MGTSLLRLILKFWSIGATLMRFTWANHSERRILVSNVCVTCNGFREFYTSDRFPYVRALRQNRWRLRTLHILKYATQLFFKIPWYTMGTKKVGSKKKKSTTRHWRTTLGGVFIVGGANAVNSFITRSTSPWKKCGPRDNTTFAYNLADVNGILHYVAERCVAESTGFFTNETWLRQHIRATETFSADSNVDVNAVS